MFNLDRDTVTTFLAKVLVDIFNTAYVACMWVIQGMFLALGFFFMYLIATKYFLGN